MARAAEPHKPKNRDFEDRSTHQGAIASIRRGLDEMVPLTRDVPSSSPALCVAQIHGRMLAMRAAGRRPFMGKHPIKHKSKEKPRVVSAAGAHRRYQLKDRVHSLQQFGLCRNQKCTLPGECQVRPHFTSKRIKDLAEQAAASASHTNLPLPEDIQQMRVAQLKRVSTALSIDIKGTKGAKAQKQLVLSAVQALRVQAPASQVNSMPRHAAFRALLPSPGLAGQCLVLFCCMLCPTHRSPPPAPGLYCFCCLSCTPSWSVMRGCRMGPGRALTASPRARDHISLSM